MSYDYPTIFVHEKFCAVHLIEKRLNPFVDKQFWTE